MWYISSLIFPHVCCCFSLMQWKWLPMAAARFIVDASSQARRGRVRMVTQLRRPHPCKIFVTPPKAVHRATFKYFFCQPFILLLTTFSLVIKCTSMCPFREIYSQVQTPLLLAMVRTCSALDYNSAFRHPSPHVGFVLSLMDGFHCALYNDK